MLSSPQHPLPSFPTTSQTLLALYKVLSIFFQLLKPSLREGKKEKEGNKNKEKQNEILNKKYTRNWEKKQ